MSNDRSIFTVEGVFYVEQKIYRDTWAEINLGAIEHNVKEMKKKLPETSQIMAVVKANGYGHGAVPVAKKAITSGATCIAVALLEEAITLREAGIDVPILVLGWVSPDHAHVAAKYDITLTMFQDDWLMNLPENLPNRLKVHMKWDTGMGRIGIRTNKQLKRILHALNQNSHIQLTGVYTHFATADESDLTYFHEQLERFEAMLHDFRELWPQDIAIHIGNSAASIRFPKKMHHYIRFGVSMYGLYPSKVLREEREIHLKQAFSLHSRLSHVKKIRKGETVSYGRTYTADSDEWIGTIPIGYGDGWRRQLQGIDVLINGKRMPIAGRICMDQTMIKLDQQYAVGTKVTLIGKQHKQTIDMDEIADYIDTINYEIPCMITSRVPRIYEDINS